MKVDMFVKNVILKKGDSIMLGILEKSMLSLRSLSLFVAITYFISIAGDAPKSLFPASHAIDFDTSMEMTKEWLDSCLPKSKRSSIKEVQEEFSFLERLYQQNNLSKIPHLATPLIPKILHQIWIGPNTPPEIFKKSQESIKKYMPGWEYKLWKDADIAKLKLENQKYYDLASNYGEKSDIARYEILYRFGGLYLDVDFVCLKPFDILHHSYDFYTGIMPLDCQATIANGIIGSAQGHPILRDCIDTIPDDGTKNKKILIRSGPIHFQKSFLKIGKDYKGPFVAFPKSFFFPIDLKERDSKHKLPLNKLLKPECFAIHYWSTSWLNTHAKKKNITRGREIKRHNWLNMHDMLSP